MHSILIGSLKVFADLVGLPDLYSYYLSKKNSAFLISILPFSFLCDIFFNFYLGTFFLCDLGAFLLYGFFKKFGAFFSYSFVFMFFRYFYLYFLGLSLYVILNNFLYFFCFLILRKIIRG